MSNDFYNHNDGIPATLTRGASTAIRSEFDLVQAGFDKLPTLAQTFADSANYVVAGGSADAWTASVSPTVLTSYTDGLALRVKFAVANTTTTPTLNLNSLGAKQIVSEQGGTVNAGDIGAGEIATLVYNGTFGKFQMVLGNSVASAQASVAAAATQAGIATTQAGIATTQAGIATTQAGIATTQAGIATTQAGIATTQAGVAAGYAAAAASSAKFFDTIALGRAGVADGATFGVKAGGSDGLARPTVYRRDSSSTQTLLYAVLPGAEYDATVQRWETVLGEPGTLQVANTTTTNGQIVFTDAVQTAGLPRITIFGGSAGGVHDIYTYTRSGNTYTKGSLIASVTVPIGAEATVQSTVNVAVGTFLGISMPANGTAYRTTPGTRAARSGGWVQGATVATSFTVAAPTYTKELQARIEVLVPVIPAADKDDVENRLLAVEYGTLPAVYATGRRSTITAESSAYAERSVIFDTPVTVGGLLRVQVYGASSGGPCLVRRYTLSGGVYTAVGSAIPIYVQPNQLNVIDTGEHIYAGDYLGIWWSPLSVAFNASAATEAGNYYFSTGSEVSYTAVSPQANPAVFSLRFEAVTSTVSASVDTTVFLGDSILEFGQHIPTVYGSRTGYPVVNGGMGGTQLAYTGVANPELLYKELSVVKVAAAIGSGSFAALTTAATNLNAYNSDDNRSIVATLAAVDWSNVTRLVVFAGTNDFANSVPLGASSDAVNTTIRGAVNLIDSQIHATYPYMQIFFVTPPWRSRIVAGDGQDPDFVANTGGIFLSQYVDAIKDQAGVTKNPALDLYRTSGINKNNKTTLIADGLHPSNDTVNTRLANKIAGFVQAYS